MKPDERDAVVEQLMDGLEPPQPHHRGIRLAWAAAVVLLVAGHALFVPGTGNGIRSIDPALIAEHRVDEYLVEMLRPTRISDNVQPIVGLFAASNGLAEIDLEGNPS